MSDEEIQDRRSMFSLVLLHALIVRDGAGPTSAAQAVGLADDLARELEAKSA